MNKLIIAQIFITIVLKFSDESTPGQISWTLSPLTDTITDITTIIPLNCKVSYNVSSQDNFLQTYSSTTYRYYVREFTVSPSPLAVYTLTGSSDEYFVCAAKGDVTSLGWTVEGRTTINENGVTVTVEKNDPNEKVSRLTVTNALKDETFTCNVTYSLSGEESKSTQLITLGYYMLHKKC